MSAGNGMLGVKDDPAPGRCPICHAIQGMRCDLVVHQKFSVEGRKDDGDKPRWDLIPLKALGSVVEVLTFGANKYADDNWRRVEGWKRRYYRAAIGHLFAWARGEKLDPESGKPHLAHAACCIFFLLELDE